MLARQSDPAQAVSTTSCTPAMPPSALASIAQNQYQAALAEIASHKLLIHHPVQDSSNSSVAKAAYTIASIRNGPRRDSAAS